MGYVTDEQFDEPLQEKFRDAAKSIIDDIVRSGDTCGTKNLATLLGLLSHYRSQTAEAIGWREAADRHLIYLERRVAELEARERAWMGGG